MDIFDRYATDANAELKGVEVPLGNATLLVARIGNPAYSKMLTALVERNKIALDLEGEAADALNEKLMVETLADTILLGWKGLTYKGADLPYSRANAVMILGHKDFRADVMKMASNMEAYKVAKEIEAGKP